MMLAALTGTPFTSSEGVEPDASIPVTVPVIVV